MNFNLFLGDVEDRLDTINGNLEEIKQLLILLLTPPDLTEYEEWKLKKRKGL
jgi:hypothetical protein|tara:strand:- start:162 stop:317 length:156 start_codon:yes stop_codon:yes gene_type:complete